MSPSSSSAGGCGCRQNGGIDGETHGERERAEGGKQSVKWPCLFVCPMEERERSRDTLNPTSVCNEGITDLLHALEEEKSSNRNGKERNICFTNGTAYRLQIIS